MKFKLLIALIIVLFFSPGKGFNSMTPEATTVRPSPEKFTSKRSDKNTNPAFKFIFPFFKYLS